MPGALCQRSGPSRASRREECAPAFRPEGTRPSLLGCGLPKCPVMDAGGRGLASVPIGECSLDAKMEDLS